MTKEVTVAELAEHLVEHLEEAKRGVTLRVVDGGKTLVTLVAQPEPQKGRPYPFRDLPEFPLMPPGVADDAVEWLIAERERERSGKKYE